VAGACAAAASSIHCGWHCDATHEMPCAAFATKSRQRQVHRGAPRPSSAVSSRTTRAWQAVDAEHERDDRSAAFHASSSAKSPSISAGFAN
jgi:hypothetical protein